MNRHRCPGPEPEADPASKLPTLTERVADPATAWQRVVIQGWYGSIGLMLPPRCGITPADGC